MLDETQVEDEMWGDESQPILIDDEVIPPEYNFLYPSNLLNAKQHEYKFEPEVEYKPNPQARPKQEFSNSLYNPSSALSFSSSDKPIRQPPSNSYQANFYGHVNSIYNAPFVHNVDQTLHGYYKSEQWDRLARVLRIQVHSTPILSIKRSPMNPQEWSEDIRQWISKVKNKGAWKELYEYVTVLRNRKSQDAYFWTKLVYWLVQFSFSSDKSADMQKITQLNTLHSGVDYSWWKYCFHLYFERMPSQREKENAEVKVMEGIHARIYLEMMSDMYEEVDTKGDGNCMYYSLLQIPISEWEKDKSIERVKQLKRKIYERLNNIPVHSDSNFMQKVRQLVIENLETERHRMSAEQNNLFETLKPIDGPQNTVQLVKLYTEIDAKGKTDQGVPNIYGNSIMALGYYLLKQTPIIWLNYMKDQNGQRAFFPFQCPDTWNELEERLFTSEEDPVYLICYINKYTGGDDHAIYSEHFRYLRRRHVDNTPDSSTRNKS